MTKFGFAALALVACGTAHAGPFHKGIGSALIYGPYTGGHNYSYNTAYSYGLSFSSADTWRRDPFAYPNGVYPYRPYGRPIQYRAFPQRAGEPAPVSVEGEDGMPVLMHPGGAVGPATTALPAVSLKPVPQAKYATVKIRAPEGARVWIDSHEVASTSGEREVALPLEAGRTYVYTVRGEWGQGGESVERVRAVGIRAGETAKVDLLEQR